MERRPAPGLEEADSAEFSAVATGDFEIVSGSANAGRGAAEEVDTLATGDFESIDPRPQPPRPRK